MTTAALLAVYLLLANAFAFGAFALDKAAAESNRRRIPERSLLLIALAGGSLGALTAQQVMRHKTRKQPFRALLIAIALLHLALALTLVFRSLGG